MKLSNEEVQILFLGIQNMVMKEERVQRRLPMLPSVRLKRMKDDVESHYETVKDARQQKEEILEELHEELKAKVDDDESDYDADDMREEINAKSEELGEEMQELLDTEVEVEFSDPVTMKDVERIDDTDENFPYISSSAMDIIIRKVVDTNGDK